MKILNAKGEQIVLNAREAMVANHLQRIVNELGFQVDITTLTSIVKKVSEQKFFEIAPADYMQVKVGDGAYSTSLLTYRSFLLGDGFETGVIDTGSNGAQLAGSDVGVDAISVKIKNWAKQNVWNLFDLQHAAKSGNWDLISAKENARKKNWDLGIQKVAFLGLKGDSAIKGLLTQSDVTVNTAIINEPISGMSETELNALTQALYEAYRVNAARTAKPTHFAIPESDFNGLASQASATYPIKTKLQLLQEAMATITMNKNFKVLPLAYADTAYSDGLLSVPRYTLYNGEEEESGRMDIPVDYTATLANSINNFQFQNVGYGQFTGFKAYRPKEFLYLDNDGP